MKRKPVVLFSPGFAAELHKRAAEDLFGHGQPRRSESAAGTVGTAKGTTQPSAAQNAQADANMQRSCVKRHKRSDPKQFRLKL